MTALGGLTKAVSMGTAMAFAAMIALALAPSGAAAAACALSIPNCGCTINSPGSYILSGASPMNSKGTCIDITASNVTLNGSSITIKGPGPILGALGVSVESTANKVILEQIVAEDFRNGVRLNGPNATMVFVATAFNNIGVVVNGANAFLIEVASDLDNAAGIQINPGATDFVGVVVEAVDATGVGIFINGANGAFLNDAVALQNGTFGIRLKSASNNSIAGFEAEDNGVAGVYLGCNDAGPNGTACPPGVPPSNGNSIMGSVYGSTNSLVTNTGSSLNQRFGIAVGLGNRGNHFLTITGTGNLNDDALDENPNCANNRWFANNFTTSSPATNTTFLCLN
jgi:parallel beta-helix repeat protein